MPRLIINLIWILVSFLEKFFGLKTFKLSFFLLGIFYIHASSPPQYLSEMCNVVGNELLKMSGPCDAVCLT